MKPPEHTPDEELSPEERLEDIGETYLKLADGRGECSASSAKDLNVRMANLLWQMEDIDGYCNDPYLHRNALSKLHEVRAILELNDEYHEALRKQLKNHIKEATTNARNYLEMNGVVSEKIAKRRMAIRKEFKYVVARCTAQTEEEDANHYQKALSALIYFDELSDDMFDHLHGPIRMREQLRELQRKKPWKKIFPTPQRLAMEFFKRGWIAPEHMGELMNDWGEGKTND